MSALTWNTPVVISGLNPASDPHIVIDSNGNSTAVWIEKSTYTTGTASQSGTTVTGSGTTFTSSMVGGTIVYANAISASITAFVSATSLTTTQTLTVSGQAYTIFYNGIVNSNMLPNGGSWGSNVQLSTTGNNAISPHIAVDSNNIVSVIWAENTVIQYVNYTSSWSSEVAISTGTGASNPVLAVDSNGNVVAAWTKSSKTETANKPISTGIWSSVTTFTTTNSSNPSIAINDGVTTIVWQAIPTTQYQIIASTATTIGGAFSTPVNLVATSGTGNYHTTPKAAVDPFGNSLAVWFRATPGGLNNVDYINDVVLASTLAAGTTSWTIAASISDIGIGNPANLILRSVYDSLGNALILWTSGVYGSLINLVSAVKQTGQSVTPYNYILQDNENTYDASIVLDGSSHLLVLFIFGDEINCDIQVVETDIGGNPVNRFSIPVTISTANTNNNTPRGAMSQTGTTINASAVWQGYDTVNLITNIQANSGSKPTLGPPTAFTVTQTINNYGVFNEYINTLNWTVSSDPNVIAYNIFRDNIWISQQPNFYTQFVDNNCVQSGIGTTVLYSLTSVDANVQQGDRVNYSIS